MEKELNALDSARRNYEKAMDRANARLAEVCDFEASITWIEGDGHLVLNVNTSDVANIECLKGKTKRNKLTEEQHGNATF